MEEMGMTNEQYKGMLLDELEDWQEVRELALETNNEKILKKADLIRETREKNFIFYELSLTVLEEIMVWISDLKGEKET